MNPVDKVRKVINEQYVAWHDVKHKPVVGTFVKYDGGYDCQAIFMFKNKTFTCVDLDGDIHGIIDGYNVHARTVAEAAEVLGLISKEERDAFFVWFRKTDLARTSESEIAKAKETLQAAGYKVTKK